MPVNRKIKQAIRERGLVNYASKKLPGGKRLNLLVFKRAGPRGGHTLGEMARPGRQRTYRIRRKRARRKVYR